MSKNKESQNMEELKKREYLKQQELLRNMSRPKQNLSADAMIENLLSKKEIFQKKVTQNQKSTSTNSMPNIVVPAPYVSIWERCKQSTSINGMEVCDTTKLQSLLMTSRLSVDMLGYIWSLSNLTIPGALTQQELYTALALVALAQSGYSFRSAAVVSQMGRYPLPMLDMSLLEASPTPHPSPHPPESVINQTVHQTIQQTHQEDEDEFDDFKSADLTGLSVDSLKVLEVNTSSSMSSSLIRFESPKRPMAGALSLLNSPSRDSPTQLCVLDLPLTETSHQPPFNKVQPSTPPLQDSNDSPDKIIQDPINSISGGILNSPRQVEDLFPKCNLPRSNDLLDWMGTPPDQPEPEEYLTCDLTTNTIQISSTFTPPAPTPNIIPNPLMDENCFSDFTSNSSPEPNKDKSSQDSISVDSLRFDDLKLTDSAPSCDKCPESDIRINTMDFDDFIPDTTSKSEITENSVLESDLLSNDSMVNNSDGLLGFEDKYSALRSLVSMDEDVGEQSHEDFGDFIAAEPVSQLQVSPALIHHQPHSNIKEECIDACLNLLNQAITSFTSVSNEKVLTEILDDHRCKKYLEELGEVYRVCERLVRGSEEGKTKLESAWSSLGSATRQALPPVKIEDIFSEGVKCGVCQEQSKLEDQVRYAMNHFHPSCASLYLHCVPNSTLPLQPF